MVEKERIRMNLESSKSEALSYLAGIAGRFDKPAETVKTCIEGASVVQTICDIAEKEKVDLVALASHGWGGSQRTFYGSVASGVINKTDQPLLLIRSRTPGPTE